MVLYEEEQISINDAVIELCERCLEINNILDLFDSGKLTKNEAFEKIEGLVYDDWYLKQIKNKF